MQNARPYLTLSYILFRVWRCISDVFKTLEILIDECIWHNTMWLRHWTTRRVSHYPAEQIRIFSDLMSDLIQTCWADNQPPLFSYLTSSFIPEWKNRDNSGNKKLVCRCKGKTINLPEDSGLWEMKPYRTNKKKVKGYIDMKKEYFFCNKQSCTTCSSAMDISIWLSNIICLRKQLLVLFCKMCSSLRILVQCK